MNRKINQGVNIGGFKRMGHKSHVRAVHMNKSIKHQIARERELEKLLHEMVKKPVQKKGGKA